MRSGIVEFFEKASQATIKLSFLPKKQKLWRTGHEDNPI